MINTAAVKPPKRAKVVTPADAMMEVWFQRVIALSEKQQGSKNDRFGENIKPQARVLRCWANCGNGPIRGHNAHQHERPDYDQPSPTGHRETHEALPDSALENHCFQGSKKRDRAGQVQVSLADECRPLVRGRPARRNLPTDFRTGFGRSSYHIPLFLEW